METNECTPPSLPDYLISYEIFPRLPPRSIHRFGCVSSSCRSLTSDPTFHSAVLRLSGRSYHLSFSVNHMEHALYSVDQSGASVAGGKTPKTLVHASTVNGLLFTVQAGEKYGVTEPDGHVSTAQGPYIATVSNPATNETFQLPPLPVLYSNQYRMFFYLCHNPESSTDRFKVIRTAVAYTGDDRNPVKTKCSIFTLGANTAASSSWRDIDLLRLEQSGNSRSVCVNGTLFLTRFRLDNMAVIGAFIGEMEKFYPVGYPARLPPARYYDCHLIELKGALAVVDFHKNGYKSEMKLWVKEKGMFELGGDSWTELRVDIDPRWEMTFRLSKSCSFSTNYEGEIVMGVTDMNTMNGCWIFTYNVEKGEWRRVEIRGVGDENQEITGDLRVEQNVTNIFSLTQTLNPSIKSST